MNHYEELLEPEKFYHIYNRGINSCNIHYEKDNYEHFLKLMHRYISPVADCLAWAIMRNHFHLLIKVHEEEKILYYQKRKKLRTLEPEIRIYQQFSNMFNAYTKAFNKRYLRTGSLFENRFRRKIIEDDSYLKSLIIYIHNNPVKHKICKHPLEYNWSSYGEYFEKHSLLYQSNEVKRIFKSKEEYKRLHENEIGNKEFESNWDF